MITKKHFIMFAITSTIFCASLNCMEPEQAAEQAAEPAAEQAAEQAEKWTKSDYYQAKNEREDLINSDITHAKRVFMNTGAQLLGTWTDRAACLGADSLRKKYFGLTEEEEAQKALSEEAIQTKKAEKTLLDSRDLHERVDAAIKLCQFIKNNQYKDLNCNARLNDLLDELDKKTKNKKS
jgi:hypothetical protein